jgi:hypothetical protein
MRTALITIAMSQVDIRARPSNRAMFLESGQQSILTGGRRESSKVIADVCIVRKSPFLRENRFSLNFSLSGCAHSTFRTNHRIGLRFCQALGMKAGLRRMKSKGRRATGDQLGGTLVVVRVEYHRMCHAFYVPSPSWNLTPIPRALMMSTSSHLACVGWLRPDSSGRSDFHACFMQ